MAQAKDKQGRPVKFIRVRGKVVPIREDKAGGQEAGGPGRVLSPKKGVKSIRRAGSRVLQEGAARDRRLAKTGRQAAGVFAAAGGLGIAGALLAKGKVGKALGAGVAGFGALGAGLNTAFASGREGSAKIRAAGAKAIASGGALKLRNAPIGAAQQGAVRDFLSIRGLEKSVAAGRTKIRQKRKQGTGF